MSAEDETQTVAEDDSREGTATPGGQRPQVKLAVFEGPLDLLLHLIKRSEVEITDIPIATITEQYLAYIEMMRDLNLDLAGEFLVMAATLTLIKSRMLLPEEPADPEEEEGDPRADLVRQLLEYQRYREAAVTLAERPRLDQDVFAREPSWDGEEALAAEPAPLKVTVWELLEAFRRVLERARPARVHEVVLEQVSLRERVGFVLSRLRVARRLDFEALFPDDASRLEFIVTFLAILELVRLRAVQAHQLEGFGPIVLMLNEYGDSVDLDAIEEYEAPPENGQGAAGEESAPRETTESITAEGAETEERAPSDEPDNSTS